MLKKIILSIIVSISLVLSSFSQIQEDLKEYFYNGEFWVAYGDYQEALYNYLRIVKKGVVNANIDYKVGLCYINLEGQKIKAIPYLQEAIKSVTTDYSDGDHKEIQAPVDAFFYLGVAQQINFEFKNAIESYRKYLALIPENDILALKFTKLQIDACKRAEEVVSKDVDKQLNPLSDIFNDLSDNSNPVISGDGNVFVYVTSQKFYDAIYFTQKNTEGTWNSPVSINGQVLSDGDLYPVSLSYDGKTMYLVKETEFDSDIYSSEYVDSIKKWTAAEKVKAISSKYWEGSACISKDGKTIYFSSNRKGTIGGADLWSITKDEKGKWSKPINLGANINTLFSEDNPMISDDGNRLYFSSQGHDGIGGYDIFYVEKNGSSWSKPVALDYPINTPDDDTRFSITYDGSEIFVKRLNNDAKKPNHDLFSAKL